MQTQTARNDDSQTLRRLVVFTRFPEPGQVKTRLIPSLGAEGAMQLHREMTRHTLRLASTLRRQQDIDVEVRFTGGDEQRMRAEFGDEVRYVPQGEGDLGQRLAVASSDRSSCTVIIGTDCPELTVRHVLSAFSNLSDHDVILGPATDGGYYLIGLKRPAPELFSGINWGTSSVFVQTQRIAAERGYSVAILDSLSDLDRIEDLPVWKEVNRRNANHSGRTLITVVIPALNEADNLPATLTPLVTLADVEVIVADGGSIDDTCGVAQRYGARVACSAPGRGRQMNAGAAQASGEMLVFLHADTRLPDDFDKHVREILLQPGIAAGAFRLKIDGSSRAMRCVEWGANMRSRWLDLPFGDQAYFVSQEVFRQVGGFHEMPILEDVEFIRRLRYYGRIVIASATVVTSARRWQRLGVVKTTWRNVMILSAYFAGVSPFRLARWYQSTR